jgi:hypothetical protein
MAQSSVHTMMNLSGKSEVSLPNTQVCVPVALFIQLNARKRKILPCTPPIPGHHKRQEPQGLLARQNDSAFSGFISER